MKPGMPWSVKGIEPETREAAKDAARRSGMTLGEWLNTVISDQADGPEMPEGAPVRQTNRVSSDSFERAASRLETIAEQLATIARRDQATSTNYVYQPEVRADQEEFTRIVSRVEHSERRQAEEFAAVNDRLQLLGRQVTQAIRTRDEFRPEEHQSFQTLEKAVRNIVEHLESSEKRTRDSLKTMQERMSDIATRAAAAPNDQVSRQAPAITQLEARLSELSRKIDEAKAAPQASLQELLAVELQALTTRIDTVRDTAESLAAKAQTEAVQAGQRELRVIEDRILGLLKDAQTTFSSGSTSPAELLRLRTDIENLNKRIDATQKPSTTDAEVAALKAVVDQMSSRIAQGPDMRPVVELHKRVNEIARRVDQTAAAPIVVPQLTVLEQRIAELDQRLAQAASQPQQQVADPRLEQKIAEVAERMDRTEQQLSHLGTIEKAINQLYDGLEANRVASKQAAEDAARSAIQQFASQQTAPSLEKAPEIIALQQGLHAIQESARGAEGRNQETLVALHETLEHIVGKLSELETAAIGQRVQQAVDSEMASAPQSHAPMHVQSHAPAHNAFADSVAEVARAHTEHQHQYHQPVELHSPVHVQDTHAEPLQPVQAAAEAFAANPFEQPSAFSVGGAPPSVQPISPADAGTTDLIAAARRAAQASHAAKSNSSFLGGLTAKPGASAKESTSLFNRFKRKSADAAAAPVTNSATSNLDKLASTSPQTGQRKKLIFAGLVILAGVATFMFNMMGRSQTQMFPEVKMPAATSSVNEKAAPDLQPSPGTKPFQQGSADIEIHEEPVGSAATVTQADEVLTGSMPNANAVGNIVSGKTKTLADMPAAEVGTESLRTAAAEGDPRAQFVVATRYLNGEKVERDFAHAAYWYGKAAASGLAPAQYRVATLYERGKGVQKDMKAALGWYERAASLGNVRSMHNAAVIASGKEAGAPDYARAFKWFSLASAYGLKDSQFNLAVLLERGLGAKAKPEEALFWYHVAAKQNDADAATRAANLMKTIAPELAARAKAKADMWSPDKSDEAANNVAIDDSAWATTTG
jgi:localization factor PodJL